MKIISTAAVTVLFFLSPLFAIEESMKAGKDAQKNQSLVEAEKNLDDQIRELAEKLQGMYTLRDIAPKVKKTPVQTVFTASKDEDGEYIELTAYAFTPRSFNYGTPVGTETKSMRLYFTGKTLTKIKTIIDDQNFYEQYKYYTKALHPDPAKGNPNEILLATAFNKTTEQAEKTPDYKTKVAEMENDSTNPNRVKFKRDFYVEHLIYFEKLFRFTFELQKRGATNDDSEIILRMKRSTRY